MDWREHYDKRHRYKNGTPYGMLDMADIGHINRKINRFTQKINMSNNNSLIISFLERMEDGLTFLLLFSMIGCFFVSVVWFFLSSIDIVGTQIEALNFGAAFYPITFLISIIVGDNLRKSISDSAEESRRYLDTLLSIKNLGFQASMLFKKSFHVKVDENRTLVMREDMSMDGVFDMVNNPDKWLAQGERHRYELSLMLCTLAYHAHTCMGAGGLHMDSNYYQFMIYKGEVLLYNTLEWADVGTEMKYAPSAEIIKKYRLLVDHLMVDFTIPKEVFNIAPRSQIIFGKNELPTPTMVIESKRIRRILLDYYTEDELTIIEYHLDRSTSKKRGEVHVNILQNDPYTMSLSAISRIGAILEAPIYQTRDISSIHRNLIDVSDKISAIWVDRQARRPKIYKQVFQIVVFFYLVFSVPLQVISNTNGYWGIVIIPTIMMIYITPLIVSEWLGFPFTNNKESMHPPHRQFRGDLCEEIMQHFGYPIEAMITTTINHQSTIY
jgi:hypothetical protein